MQAQFRWNLERLNCPEEKEKIKLFFPTHTVRRLRLKYWQYC